MTRSFYQVLGIAPQASPADVRAAYIRLVKLHHPDADGSLPGRLREVQQAYRCLSDADARAAHDRLLAERHQRHADRQRRVWRRLQRYDRRHPPGMPRPAPRRWRLILVVTAAAAAAVRWGVEWLG